MSVVLVVVTAVVAVFHFAFILLPFTRFFSSLTEASPFLYSLYSDFQLQYSVAMLSLTVLIILSFILYARLSRKTAERLENERRRLETEDRLLEAVLSLQKNVESIKGVEFGVIDEIKAVEDEIGKNNADMRKGFESAKEMSRTLDSINALLKDLPAKSAEEMAGPLDSINALLKDLPAKSAEEMAGTLDSINALLKDLPAKIDKVAQSDIQKEILSSISDIYEKVSRLETMAQTSMDSL